MAASAEGHSTRSPVIIVAAAILAIIVLYVGTMVALGISHNSSSARAANACGSYRTVLDEFGRLAPLLRPGRDRDDLGGALAAIELGRGLGAERFPPRVDRAIDVLMRGIDPIHEHPKAKVDPARLRAAAQTLDRWGATCHT
jgi:hypothetical protein